MDFRINSNAITTELYTFITTGNGILTGNPGAGKSYEIGKLLRCLKENGYTVLPLPIDKLVAESDLDLQNELDLTNNLIEYLANEPQVSSAKKGIVIIDAFDAARSGNKRNFYLKLIRKIIAKLGDEWNVLVVVRLYDAKKSGDLLNIFSDKPDTDRLLNFEALKVSKEIPCRHVILPELKQEDLDSVINLHPELSKISHDLNPRLKNLLYNPFYISLVLSLIQIEREAINLKSIYSEVQLLDLYWDMRIEKTQSGIDYDILLTELSQMMIENHSLSVPISAMPHLTGDKISYLMSSGILTDVGINKTKIAFSHNILFDYAVSRLAINDDENGLMHFISSDKSNIVFLKPSILYYLTKIWYNDKKLFKKISLKIYKAKESEIPLLAKIMPTQVLVQEAESVNDIQFIFSLYADDSIYRNWLHATIFSTLTSLSSDVESQRSFNRRFWLNYFEQIVENSKNPYDFNFVGWLSKIQKDDNDSTIQLQIGRISRKILSTCLELRKSDRTIDSFASHLPVILVVNTFGTDSVQSREILDRVFEIAHEPDFDLSYLFSVAFNIREIFSFDPEFISKFYILIFSRNEESTKQTELSNVGFLRLTSNRRQDFEGIRYHLGQESGALLDSNLKMGLRTLIQSVNYGICKQHVRPYPDGRPIQEKVEVFPFYEKEAKYLEDYCYIWSDSHYQTDAEFEILTQIKNKLIKIAENPNNKSELETALMEYRDHAIVSILWRDLLKLIASNPEPFSNVIPDLICAKPLQMHSETIDELAELIETSVRLLSDAQINQIVARILNTFDEIEDKEYKKYLQVKRNFLLSKIPSKFYPTDELKRDLGEYCRTNSKPPRKPIEFSATGVRNLTEEDILEFKKIDPLIDDNKTLLPSISAIKKFNDKWSNEHVSTEDASAIEHPLKTLLDQIEDPTLKIQINTYEYAWEELSRCAKIISRELESSTSNLYEHSRKILLKSATVIPTQEIVEFTQDYDPLAWSPNPVTEAAEGLLHLYILNDDDEIWESIEKLSRDRNPVVRSLILLDLVILLDKHQEKYWDLIDVFIKNDDNFKIHELICYSLNSTFRKNPTWISESEARIEKILIKSKKTAEVELGFINNNCFFSSVSYFAFVDESQWAKEFFEEVIQKPDLYSLIRPRIVSLLINQFFKTPTIFNKKFDGTRSSISIWLNQIIISTFHEIQIVLSTQSQLADEEKKQIEKHYDVIEEFITRFFFVVDKKYNKIDDEESQILAIESVYHLEKDTFELLLDSMLKLDKSMIIRGHEMQYLMGILDSCLSQDPEKVLELTLKSLMIGQRIGYSSDYLGQREIQNFIEHLLVDHREILEGRIAMNNFTELLDNYIRGNNPDAMKFIMSIDLEYN